MRNPSLRAYMLAITLCAMSVIIASPAMAQGLPTTRGPSCLSATGIMSACQGVFLTDSNGNPIPAATPAPWVTGSTPQDARSFNAVTIQVEGLSGGDTIAVTGSLSGNGYTALTGIGADFSTVTTISADGIYSFDGGQYLKWAKTGSASTPTLTIRTGG